MLQFLLPKEPGFFDHFEEHAAATLRAARALEDLLRHPEAATDKAAAVKDIEREADAVTRRCVRDLHSTFITPLERGDIHSLIRRLDEVVDHIDGVARRVALYRPAALPPELAEMAALLVRAAEAILDGMQGMREMSDPPGVFARCGQLIELEEESDQLYARAIARLFSEEQDPLEVIKLREILEVAEGAADACEEVARILEGVVLEHL